MVEQQRDTQHGGQAGTDAFLGKGSHVSGKVVLSGPGHIEGRVEGEISAQGTLVIGDGAVVNAQVTGETIVIHGQVTGDVTARQKLELRRGCRVSGNISAPRLVVEEGAAFEGQCTMAGDKTTRLGDKPETSLLLRQRKDELAVPPAVV
jgi:cytoskeletal protein CcmA (bactofilin family)